MNCYHCYHSQCIEYNLGMAIKAIPIRSHGEGFMEQSYYHLQGLHCPLRLVHNPSHQSLSSTWSGLHWAAECVPSCGSAALHECQPRSEQTLSADCRPYFILGGRGQVAPLEVVLTSTAVAEWAAIALRPSFAGPAEVHDSAGPDVMVASASNAAPTVVVAT